MFAALRAGRPDLADRIDRLVEDHGLVAGWEQAELPALGI